MSANGAAIAMVCGDRCKASACRVKDTVCKLCNTYTLTLYADAMANSPNHRPITICSPVCCPGNRLCSWYYQHSTLSTELNVSCSGSALNKFTARLICNKGMPLLV